jgi:hypothetical protein
VISVQDAPLDVLLVSSPALRARLEPDARAALGEHVRWLDLPRAAAGLPERLAALSPVPAVAVVLMPSHGKRAPALPYPMQLGSTVVGTVPYARVEDVQRWLRAVRAAAGGRDTTLITAMQKPLYVLWAERIARTFRAARPERTVSVKLPESTTCGDLAAELARGFRLCIYAGHGRGRGWSGYRGVRFADLEAAFEEQGAGPAHAGGAVISLSCATLCAEREGITPFGVQWLGSGRLGAYLGATGPVEIEPLARITALLLEARAALQACCLADLVRYVTRGIHGQPSLQNEWSKFRLLGNPLQRV